MQRVQTKGSRKKKKEGGGKAVNISKDALVIFTRVNNMENRTGFSSHNMLKPEAKGKKWTLTAAKELLLNGGYSVQFQF